MKVLVTYKRPFDTPSNNIQNNSVTINNVTNIAYASATDTVTITYGSGTTIQYTYTDVMIMLIN